MQTFDDRRLRFLQGVCSPLYVWVTLSQKGKKRREHEEKKRENRENIFAVFVIKCIFHIHADPADLEPIFRAFIAGNQTARVPLFKQLPSEYKKQSEDE